jgi:hypothetical protein
VVKVFGYNEGQTRMTAPRDIYALSFDTTPELREAVSEALREANMPPLLGLRLLLVNDDAIRKSAARIS